MNYFNKIKFIKYEILGSIGYGHNYYYNQIDDYPNYEFTMFVDRFISFIQPNISYRFLNIAEFGLFSRFIYNNYFNISSEIIYSGVISDYPNSEKENKFFSERSTADLFFLEPGFCARVGGRYVKFQTIFFPTFNLTDTKVRFREYNVYLSVFLKFNLLEKKR